MSVKFIDLYNAIRGSETAFRRMDLDIGAVMCGFPKCVISKEQEKLMDSYMELSNIEVDFCDMDMDALIARIQECFDCVTDEFTEEPWSPLPEPEEKVDNCVGGTIIPLIHIKRFRIYERTWTHASIPSPIQVYVMTKDMLPYTFTPSVPPIYSSHERYYVSWNEERDSLVVKVDNDTFPETSNAPAGSFNIAHIVAEIDDIFQADYGVTEVPACTAMLMTPGVRWRSGYGLEKAVDMDASTWTVVDNSLPEVTVEFQFKI